MAHPSDLARPEATLAGQPVQASSSQDVTESTHNAGFGSKSSATLQPSGEVSVKVANSSGLYLGETPSHRGTGGAPLASGAVEAKPTSMGLAGGAPTPLGRNTRGICPAVSSYYSKPDNLVTSAFRSMSTMSTMKSLSSLFEQTATPMVPLSQNLPLKPQNEGTS